MAMSGKKASGLAWGLSRGNGLITFTVTDDGRGFDTGATGYGTGVQGMADRLDAMGGELSITSAVGQGATVSGQVPVGGDLTS